MPAKRSNGAHSADYDLSAAASLFPATAMNGFALSQRVALEAARFWARRMRAYADQMETLASCATPNQFVTAQTSFLEKLKDDYAAESEALSEIWKVGAERQAESLERVEGERH